MRVRSRVIRFRRYLFADHGTNVVEVTDAQGTITGSEVVDYDELISDYRIFCWLV